MRLSFTDFVLFAVCVCVCVIIESVVIFEVNRKGKYIINGDINSKNHNNTKAWLMLSSLFSLFV